jgi:hypothetical protein
LSLDLRIIGDYSTSNQEFKVWVLEDDATCIAALAGEYRNLRTECVPSIGAINVDGIGIVDTTQLRSFLASRTIPRPLDVPFDVIRSDMGETLAYMILEQEYSTRFGYKSVRDRELIQLSGRGIDAVGVENDDTLTLLLGEVKVSGEDRNPPQVVDRNNDSISKSLLAHIKNHDETSRKIWDMARRSRDTVFAELLFAAAIYWDEKKWSHLHVICCGVLVRPQDKHKEKDFGLLKDNPGHVAPARVRFLIICVNNDLEETVSEFYRLATAEEEVS